MTGRFTEAVIEEVRAANDIVDVVGEHVVLRKTGKNHVGLCPFHSERTPSFTVAPDKQIYKCFGCQAAGNVFTFVMKREGLSFPEAVERLAARAGIRLPEQEVSPAEARRQRELESILGALEAAAALFRQFLLATEGGAAARQYLDKRGLAPATVERFGLGYAPDAWDALARALAKRGISAELAERAGLLVKSEQRGSYYDRFRNRVMFPIANARGRVVGFGGRALDDAEPKYLNSPETGVFSKGKNLYGANLAREAARQAGRTILVEGYMDLIAVHEAGMANVVASLGTALTRDQCRALTRLAPAVVIAYDADAAGQAATLRGLDLLSEEGAEVTVALPPEGKDPDELIRRHGADTFRQAVEEAVSLVEYKFRLALGEYDVGTVEGRVKATARIVPVLARLPNAVEQDGYIKDFAPRLATSETALRAEVARYQARSRADGEPRAPWGEAKGEVAAALDPGRHRNGAPRHNSLAKPAKIGVPAVAGSVGGAVAGGVAGAGRGAVAAAATGAGLVAERHLLRLMVVDPSVRERIARELGGLAYPFLDPDHAAIAEAIARACDERGGVGGAVGAAGAAGQRLFDYLDDDRVRHKAADLLDLADIPELADAKDRILDDLVKTIRSSRVQVRITELERIVAEKEQKGASALNEREELLELVALLHSAKVKPAERSRQA